MPETIGFIATVVASTTASASLATGLYFATYTALSAGLLVGGALLQGALAPRQQAPTPQDGQQSRRQSDAPRVRHYGRVKISGPWAFGETKGGSLHKVILLGTGRLDAIEEYWIDETQVTRGSDGTITGGRFGAAFDEAAGTRPQVFIRLGDDSQTAYSELTSQFPEWTEGHRLNGISSLYVFQKAVSDGRHFGTYPNGVETKYRVVARGARIKNPVTDVVAWDDNAAAVIMDYIVHPDGMRMPASLIETPQAVVGWQEAYNWCETAFALAAGGTEPRYRLWGSYRFDERPADVLRRMLDCCDGRLMPTPDGGITLDVGQWNDDDVILDESVITGINDLGRGRDVLETANTIRATYLAADNDYQALDADPFADEDDVGERGELGTDKRFEMAPSHSQARRLMKLALYRANPLWVATFQCNLKALKALGRRRVRVVYPQFGINEPMEIDSFKINIDRGLLRSITVSVKSMPDVAYDWDTSQEGTAPVFDQTTPDTTIPTPTGFDVTIIRKTIGGAQVPFARLEFDTPPAASLLVAAEGRRVGDTDWIQISVADEATTAESFALSDGEDYQFRIWYVSFTGSQSAKTAPIEITAIGDPTPPDQITSVVATGGAGIIDYSWVSPNSQNFAATNIYRNTVNDEGTATLVRTEYGPQSNSDSWQETGLSAGTYYAWLTARNTSGVEATPKVGTGAITVT